MRFVLLFGALIMLAGCQSYFDDQQRRVDEANAKRDHRWCESLGIAKADSRYPACRIVAADLRLQGRAQADAKALTLLGIGASTLPKDDGAVTCQTIGNTTTCQ